MICPECQNYYEYKGEVSLKEGELSVKWAVDKIARACMERMIGYITGIKKTQVWQEKATNLNMKNKFSGSSQLCLFGGNGTEKIPIKVVRDFDAMDDGDPSVPPQFSCQRCGGEMYPSIIKGFTDMNIKFRIFAETKARGFSLGFS
jgi:hypothetical protein